jgi:hypothetical protein
MAKMVRQESKESTSAVRGYPLVDRELLSMKIRRETAQAHDSALLQIFFGAGSSVLRTEFEFTAEEAAVWATETLAWMERYLQGGGPQLVGELLKANQKVSQ